MEILLSILGLLFVAVLTLGTGLAVAAEFSLTSLERSTIDAHVAQVGDRRAKAVQRAHRQLSFQLSGAQVAVSLTVAILLATTLSMVFGEMVPKNLAIARPLPTARAVSGYHSLFSLVFRW